MQTEVDFNVRQNCWALCCHFLKKCGIVRQKCWEKFKKLNLVILCRWADTLWALASHKEKDWLGLAARRVARSGELVGDLQGGRGAQKGQKSCGTVQLPTKLPLYTARSSSQPFCGWWSFLLGRHYSLRQEGPERRIYKERQRPYSCWRALALHVVFTFCSAVQFLWVRLSLEGGGRILIPASSVLVTREEGKGWKKRARAAVDWIYPGFPVLGWICWIWRIVGPLSTSLHHLFQLRLPETQNTELIPANYMIYNSKLLDCCYWIWWWQVLQFLFGGNFGCYVTLLGFWPVWGSQRMLVPVL